jgi:general secretion pathway protein G
MEYSIHFLQKKRGMSLIEIMLVIAVGMGLMAGLVTIYKKVQNSLKRSSTQSLLFEVQNGLEEFRRDLGRYPVKIDELVAGPADANEKKKWSGQYVSNKDSVSNDTVVDSYGNEIVYVYDKSKNKFELYSWGPQGPGAEYGHISLEK